MENNKKKDALEALVQQNTEKGYVLEDYIDEICDTYDLSDSEFNWLLNALDARNITVCEKEPAPSLFSYESQPVSEPESESYQYNANYDIPLYGTTLQMTYAGKKAWCQLTPEGCLLLRGSQIRHVSNAKSTPFLSLERQLYESKIDWTHGELLEDILFSSPTSALRFVTGSHAAAGKVWKDAYGTPLCELRKNADTSQATASNVTESFSPKQPTSSSSPAKPISNSSSEKQGLLPNGLILYMEHEHGEAICRYTYSNEEDYYTLLKGSIVNTTVSSDCPGYIQTARARNKDRISETGEVMENILLKGVNRSAGFVTGKKEDGLQLWHDDKGHTLYSLLYQREAIENTKMTIEETPQDVVGEKDDTEREDVVVEKDDTEREDVVVEKDDTEREDVVVEKDDTEREDVVIEKDDTERKDVVVEKDDTEREDVVVEKDDTEREEVLKKSIDALGLSVPSFQCLKRAQLNTIGDLIGKSQKEMMTEVRNFGKKKFNEVREKLQSLGLDFKED